MFDVFITQYWVLLQKVDKTKSDSKVDKRFYSKIVQMCIPFLLYSADLNTQTQ